MPIFGAFGAVVRTLDNKGAVALFALMDAFAAEIVIGDTVTVIQEKCPFLFSFFAHSWHWLAPFCGAVKSCVPVSWTYRGYALREALLNCAEWWKAPYGGIFVRGRRYRRRFSLQSAVRFQPVMPYNSVSL